MGSLITIQGIDQAIQSLGLDNENSLKFKLLNYIRHVYADEASIALLKTIDADEMIRTLWNLGDVPDAVRFKRKNFNAIKSSINAALKASFQSGENPQGIIIGPENTFVMSEEAKDSVLQDSVFDFKPEHAPSLPQLLEALQRIQKTLKDTLSENPAFIADDSNGFDALKRIVNAIHMNLDPSASSGNGQGGNRLAADPYGAAAGYAAGNAAADQGEPTGAMMQTQERENLGPGSENQEQKSDSKTEGAVEDNGKPSRGQADLRSDPGQGPMNIGHEKREARSGTGDGFSQVRGAADADPIGLEAQQEAAGAAVEAASADVSLDSPAEDLPDPAERIEADELEEVLDEALDEILEDAPEEALPEEPDEDIVEDIAELEEAIEDDVATDVLEEIHDEDVLLEAVMDAADADVPEPEEEDEVLDLEEVLDEDALLADAGANGGTALRGDDVHTESGAADSALELGLPVGSLGSETCENSGPDIDKAKLLAEQFDGYLGAMDRYYNQYVIIRQGEYCVGAGTSRKTSRPERKVALASFYMGVFPVTNALFEIFIQKTGYRTTAEKTGFGTVFHGRLQKIRDERSGQVISTWNASLHCESVAGAFWYQPSGPGSNLHNKRDHPVVQVSLEDAAAFAAWTGKRLATEDEWEAACRTMAGLTYPWGDRFQSHACNIEATGIGETTAVDAYGAFANALGIVDAIGNVLEWTQDSVEMQTGANRSEIYAIAKGGSWTSDVDISLADRFKLPPESHSNILGFRCVAI